MGEILLYKAMGPTDAYLLRQWLAERGIVCRIEGEARMSLAGGIPMPDTWPRVWVGAGDEVAAREALVTWRGPTLVHPSWSCHACGEENPASFDLCWNCERAR